jgi:membrane-associated phospholipid phosphatase
MLPLALALIIGSVDTPAAETATRVVPAGPVNRAADVNIAALYAPPPQAFETRYFPPMPGTRVLLNIGSTLARPFRPELTDLLVIVPGVVGTVVALQTDLESYRLARKIPDPQIDGKGLSFYVSYGGEGWVDVAIFLAVGLIGGRDGQRACIAGLQALAAAAIATRVGKIVFRLERPSYDPDAQHFFARPEADAMPSGHAMTAFATATVLSLEYPKFSPLFYTLALWVGLARVQQNAHWVSDIVVGAALGTLFGWQSYKLTRAFEIELQPWAGANGAGLNVARRF